MKLVLFIFLILLVVALGTQIYTFSKRVAETKKEYQTAQAELQKIKAQNEALTSDSAYYASTHNLEKELRTRFNFRAKDETMIIIVPPKATSTP